MAFPKREYFWKFKNIPFFVFCLKEGRMIEVILNDRLGRKIRVKCNPSDTIGDLKKLVAAQTGRVDFFVSLTVRNTSREN